jgi:hypothetical protein
MLMRKPINAAAPVVLPISAKVRAQIAFGVNPDDEMTVVFVETFDLTSDHRHRAVGNAFS